MVIEVRDGSEVPISLQLRNQIVSGISAGALEPGEQLPTVRALAAELGVNATVRRRLGTDISAACGQLRREDAQGK